MEQTRIHLVVIGGGITGLTAAFYLHSLYSAIGTPPQITLLEKSDTLGGSIQTLRKDGFIIEKGPDSFLGRKPAIHRLCRDIGLQHEMVSTNPSVSKSFVYLNNRLHPMPDGLALGIPTQLKPFMTTRLLSISGKARAALDFILPRKNSRDGESDESLGSLIERRLGREVADCLVGPVLAGIYAGDLKMLSTRATFPQLQQMEADHGSIIRGMLAGKRKQMASVPDPVELPSHLKGSMFLSLKNGLISLVEQLTNVLETQGTDIKKNCAISGITRMEDKYRLTLSDQSAITADGVIVAVPASQAAQLIEGQLDKAAQLLRKIPAVSVANVAVALKREDVPAGVMQGSGFVVPRNQGLTITACTWSSVKWAHTSPDGKVLLRAYIGHWGDQSHTDQDDEELIACVIHDLQKVMGFPIAPLFTVVTRHPGAMQQYATGHLERLELLERELAQQWPQIVLAGASYRGLGIPDCVQQGREAAELLARRLGGTP
jgi:oxygen-dependent protoporphyrinogen oxidase